MTKLSIVSVLLLVFACSSPTKTSNSNADIVGTITEINVHSNRLEILVEEDTTVYGPDKKMGKKILLYISEKTEIYKQSNANSLNKITSEYLKVGMKVKARARKLVLLSYPAQAGALQIIIVGH